MKRVRSHHSGMVGRVIEERSNCYNVEWPDGREYTVLKWNSDVVKECECCRGWGVVKEDGSSLHDLP